MPSRFTRPLASALLLAIASGPSWAATEDCAERLGVMTHFAQNWDVSLISRIGDAGIGHVRDELYWDVVESKPGIFVFPAMYDNYMAALKARGISPLIPLTFANHNYDDGLTPYSDAAIAAYARYAVEVLRHYGTQIHAVEIWNEYNGSFSNGPVTDNRSANYVRMLKAAYTAIKQERPDVTVVGVAAAGLPLPYLEKIFQAGGLGFMDAVSVHPYRFDRTPEGLEIQIEKLNRLIARYSPDHPKPVWVTEIGWATRVSQAEGDLAINEQTKAVFLVRAFTLLLSARVERAYWYLFRDYNEFATMGQVYANEDASPKPSYYAMATLLEHLRGTSFSGRIETAPGIYALRFARGDATSVYILWSLKPIMVRIPAKAAAYDWRGIRLTEPEISLTDMPVYIEGAQPALPPPVPQGALLADAEEGFSSEQNRAGWSYGAFVGDSIEFEPLQTFQVTDWKEEWVDVYPYISVSASEQHPSSTDGQPVSAVRRWRTDADVTVQVTGSFKVGLEGDGVRVRVLAGDRVLFARTLGGGGPVLAEFDFETQLKAGDALDFAVDSGPAGRADFDVTATSAVIRNKNSQ